MVSLRTTNFLSRAHHRQQYIGRPLLAGPLSCPARFAEYIITRPRTSRKNSDNRALQKHESMTAEIAGYLRHEMSTVNNDSHSLHRGDYASVGGISKGGRRHVYLVDPHYRHSRFR